MLLIFAFGVDKDVIEVHYHKNVELFCQDLIDIALEHSQCISQSKRYHLVFKMTITASKGRFPFIAFSDSHLMVGIDEIELDKTPNSI